MEDITTNIKSEQSLNPSKSAIQTTYKPSGIEWQGQVPTHWHYDKLFRVCSNMGSGGTPKSSNQNFYGGPIKWIQSGDLTDGYVSQTSKTITEEALEKSSAKMFPKGTLLVAMYGATIGKLGIMEMDAATNQACCSLQLSSKIDSKYAYYLMLDARDYLLTQAYGGGQPNISQETLKQFHLVYAPLPEQKAIAEYLDKATAKIDRIIAIKKEQLEKMEESWQSKMQEQVTGKIEGVQNLLKSADRELLNLPPDWSLKRIKQIGKIKYGLGQPPKELDGGLPIIRATNVSKGFIDEHNMIYVDPEDVPYSRDPVLREGDIIVVRSGAYTADSAIIPAKYEGAITGYDMVLRCYLNVSAKFVSYCLLSKYVLNDQMLLSSLRAAQPHLNKEELGNTYVLIPSLSEQERIVEVLDNIQGHFLKMKTNLESQIQTLQSYRKSLIHECVTGKKQVSEPMIIND
ncbi:restriction endonuclease subunit S [Reichenbachiella sp. MSK19-1]|uniref:restriction endonuclease subunit S n=1 Tax=Reichenbachiella sp. MSK19-1 TaxID=1897631 RepID=UPI000E6C7D06|nr:restriction endonuclease subunit S [Reichenbachiella sp. MSK19-1]RJE72821.1 hypothetical protein BGP76_02395 [Reichenbachiella sp. MSK19-1]